MLQTALSFSLSMGFFKVLQVCGATTNTPQNFKNAC